MMFTLLELLIVVAIIAIILAILFPALREAKRTAWTVDCRSNMRQVGTAMNLYTVDNDGLIPPGSYWGGGNYDTNATNPDGTNIDLGTRARGGGQRIPKAAIQHLLKTNDYISKYLWCHDMTIQETIERIYGYPNDTGPGYGLTRDIRSHVESGVGYWSRSSYSDNTLFKCNHLLYIASFKSSHLMLGEAFAQSWSLGYNVPSESIYYPYVYQDVAFRHHGYRANFLMMDNHVETWDRNEWNEKYTEIANEFLLKPMERHY